MDAGVSGLKTGTNRTVGGYIGGIEREKRVSISNKNKRKESDGDRN